MMSTREFLIDGYNLMHQFPQWQKLIQNDLTLARERLLALLCRFVQTKRVRVTVIFDGQEGKNSNTHFHGIQILFSKPPQKADDLLKKYIAKYERRKEWTVVTSDREIVHYAKACGVSVESSKHFAQSLIYKESPHVDAKYGDPPPLTEKEIAQWLELFEKRHSSKNEC